MSRVLPSPFPQLFSSLFTLVLIPPLPAEDCNANYRDDSDDIITGLSQDCNRNGVPDECDLLPTFGYLRALNTLSPLRPRRLIAIDLDQDGDQDLVTANFESGNISIISNAGNQILLQTEILSSGAIPSALLSADFDSDGDPDLAVAASGSNEIAIFLNSGGGHLLPMPSIAVGKRPWGLAAADLDGDQKPDLAASNLESNTISILTNQGNGKFTQVRSLPTGPNPGPLVAADFNNDGLPDLAVADRLSGDRAAIFFNQGDATFSSPRTSILTGRAEGLIVEDLDGDTLPDLALLIGSSKAALIRNRGKDTFEIAKYLDLPFLNYGIAAADIDKDGDTDLLFSGDGFTVFENKGNLGFTQKFTQSLEPPGTSTALVPFDIDRDGDLDFAVTSEGECCTFRHGSISICKNDGTGSFEIQNFPSLRLKPRAVTGADFDGDGLMDIATGNLESSFASLPNSGNGKFDRAKIHFIGAVLAWIASGDLDANGLADLVIADENASAVSLVLNRGNGNFESPTTFPVSSSPYFVALADTDQDNDLDLWISSNRGFSILYLSNDGSGNFSEKKKFSWVRRPFAMTPIDLEGDGELDLAIYGDGAIYIWKNTGNLNFEIDVAYYVALAGTLEAADADGDAKPDLVFGSGSNNFGILRNIGNGKFERMVGFTVGPQNGPRIASGNFEGDSSLEFVSVNPEADQALVISGLKKPSVSADSFLNGIPDECDLENNDCNGNRILDSDEISRGAALDCNRNQIPDDCDFEPSLQLEPAMNFPVDIKPYAVVADDFNGDGKMDLATANLEANSVSVLLNHGSRKFSPETNYGITANAPGESSSAEPTFLIAADLDGDGDKEIVTANSGRYSISTLNGTLSILWNDGQGIFHTAGDPLITETSTLSVAAADLEGDGDLELIATNIYSQELSVFYQISGGQFAPATSLATPGSPALLVTTDLDNRNGPDLVFTASSGLVVLKNLGNGTFEAPAVYESAQFGGRLTASDLDGDSDQDVAVTFTSQSNLQIFLNKGSGELGSLTNSLFAVKPFDVASGDFDLNGFNDLAVSSSPTGRVTVLLNQGNLAFKNPKAYFIGKYPLGITAADLDGESSLDIAASVGEFDREFNTVAVLFNISKQSRDCNGNNVPDECDIASGLLKDNDGDGLPEDCPLKLPFHRGDPNNDGAADITDPILVLEFLFLGEEAPSCLEAADFNNNGTVDITDAISELEFLFLTGSPPSPPGAPPSLCGPDPDAPGSPGDIPCVKYTSC
ncbi:MAG: VCBS repeat-containing protein [Planctomycetes bacterium]|nr:VCBS repeat-containing protein [Planctomycetota bacterium]